MRHPLLPLLLLAFALPAAAQDSIADYMKLLGDSKQRYNMVDKLAKEPMEEWSCPAREITMRVVRKGDVARDLVEWKTKPEVLALMDEAEKAFQANDYDHAAEK